MYSLTKEALKEFSDPHEFEKMCTDILNALEYRDVEPIAPGGGGDGGKDITFITENGGKGLACVTLRKDIRKKFYEDFSRPLPGEYEKYILFCNVSLTATQKQYFTDYCQNRLQALFVPRDLESLRSLLDSKLTQIREQYLHIRDERHANTEISIETMERLAQGYRDSIKFDAQIAYLQIPGMREPMALNTSYAHLRLHMMHKLPDDSHTMDSNRDPDEIMESDQEDLNKRAQTALTPEQVIREKTRCIIMGDPGSGKTTLLKHLALSSANKDIEDLPDLPVYIKLNEFVESKCKSLLEFAATDWNKRCGLSKANALSYLEKRLRSGNLLMLLDALDETKIGKTAQKAEASYLRAVRAIQDLTKISSTAPIVVTIRKTYLPETTLEGFSIFDVLDLQQKDIYRFVENWFKGQSALLKQIDIAGIKAQLDHNSRIIALAANPLMLSLILLTYHDQFEEIPERRAKLFERCVNMLLMEWNSKRKLRHPPRFDIEQKQLLLQYIAWHFHTRGQREFSENELLAAIAEFLNESKLSKYQILGLIRK